MEKTALESFLETVSFSGIKRDILGEDCGMSLAELKQELFYYIAQANNGPEKTRHIMRDKADKIKAEIAKHGAKS